MKVSYFSFVQEILEEVNVNLLLSCEVSYIFNTGSDFDVSPIQCMEHIEVIFS